jgi:hypothetical protein
VKTIAITRRSRTPLDLLVIVSAIISLLSQWTISIAPAHLAETFGIESAACWLAVIGMLAALALDVGLAVIAVFFTEVVLVAWYGWATWVVTTPRFTNLPFPFTPTDLMGPGWYAAGAGLLLAAGAVIRELRRRHAPPRGDLWLLTAIPGFGLLRMGRWFEGGVWAGLFIAAVYLASTDSPDSTEFADLGRYGAVPPPFPRGAEWVLLGTAVLFWIVSIAITVWRRRNLQTRADSD